MVMVDHCRGEVVGSNPGSANPQNPCPPKVLLVAVSVSLAHPLSDGDIPPRGGRAVPTITGPVQIEKKKKKNGIL